MESISDWLNAIWINYESLPFETQSFIAAIAALGLLFHARFTAKTVAYGPTILTTLGIFATFLAIALGLSKFDSTDVQASVPALLNSLTTAFWASVVGVGSALTLKFRHFFIGSRQRESLDSEDDVTAADLANHLIGIRRAIAGDDADSLVNQTKRSRQDSNDRLDALSEAQTAALNKLSEMGSKTLVEALRDVIRDFNSRISEQFGENFQQLNQAVGRLLDWQTEYKEIVQRSANLFDEIARTTKGATEQYAEVVEHSRAFAVTATSLGSMLTELNSQRDRIAEMTRALGQLLESSRTSLPEVESKLLEITNQLARAMSETQATLAAALSESATTMKDAVQSTTQTVANSNAEQSKQIATIVAKTKEQITQLDDALTNALEQSLTSLGQQLTALSEHFVRDYTPLTERLRNLLEVAENR
jgi:hypothetical protein